MMILRDVRKFFSISFMCCVAFISFVLILSFSQRAFSRRSGEVTNKAPSAEFPETRNTFDSLQRSAAQSTLDAPPGPLSKDKPFISLCEQLGKISFGNITGRICGPSGDGLCKPVPNAYVSLTVPDEKFNGLIDKYGRTFSFPGNDLSAFFGENPPSPLIGQIKTDKDGIYTFKNIPLIEYQIQATAHGFKPASAGPASGAGAPTAVIDDITLEPANAGNQAAAPAKPGAARPAPCCPVACKKPFALGWGDYLILAAMGLMMILLFIKKKL